MNTAALLTEVFTYLLAGVVSVPVAKRLGLGSVLGYLVAGVVIGPSALNLIGDPTQVMHVAEFGVVILLFLIGLEVRPALLWDLRGAIFGLGGAQVLLSTAAGAGIALALGLPWRTAVACGAILSMSSTAIVLSMLEERGLRKGPVGSAAFGVLLFQDLAVIPLFILLPLLALEPATGAGAHGRDALAWAPVWLKPALILGAIAAVVWGGRYAVRPLFRYIAGAELREIFTAAALLIVVAVAALMTAVGLSPALGAFLAGVVLAESEFRRELESDIDPFRGLLLGLFFVTVGAGLDLALVRREPLLLAGLVLALMTAKTVVMLLAARVSGMRLREAAATAVALSQGGEFAFVLVTFTVGAAVIPAELGRLLSAVVALSMVLTPFLFALFQRAAERLSRTPRETRDADVEFDDGADVIVAGFGRFGQIAGRLLVANGFQLSVMDSSLQQIDLLRRFGRRVNYGDASRLDLLRAAGAQTARVLIVAIDDRAKAEELVETAKAAFPHLVVLARAFDRGHAYELLAKGADHAERETYEASLAVGREALVRLGFRPVRARRAADIFRVHDGRLFDRLRPAWDLDDDGFITASRQAQATLEKLLAADLAADADAPDEDDERRPLPDLTGAW